MRYSGHKSLHYRLWGNFFHGMGIHEPIISSLLRTTKYYRQQAFGLSSCMPRQQSHMQHYHTLSLSPEITTRCAVCGIADYLHKAFVTLYCWCCWVKFNGPPNTLQVISGTGFYGSNDPHNSVKAHKEGAKIRLQSHQVYPTVLQ